jgi:outer membrane immunogenic protein
MKTKMIRTGFAIAALLIAPTFAQAADLPSKAPVYSSPVYANWTGFYVGLNGGYGFGKSNWDVPAVSPSPKGGLFGATIGYNFQTGSWVWGAEGDFDISTMKGSSTCSFVSCETKDSWLGTARGRIGYAGWNNWLPYLTGGLAVGDIKADSSLGSANKTNLGYAVGAGVEYAMWSSWSVKLEYLYVDLGKFNCGVACGGVTPDNVSFKTNIVRAGLNYRF